MEVPGDLLKSVSRNSLTNRGIVQPWVPSPVVSYFWEVVDPHQDVETKVCTNLLRSSSPLIVPPTLCCVAIGFSHNQIDDVIVEEEGE